MQGDSKSFWSLWSTEFGAKKVLVFVNLLTVIVPVIKDKVSHLRKHSYKRDWSVVIETMFSKVFEFCINVRLQPLLSVHKL